VDLKIKPMSLGELKRFTDRFGLSALVDTEGAPWVDAGLKYMKMSDADMIGRIAKEPKLLRLPLVRCGSRLCFGQNEEVWLSFL